MTPVFFENYPPPEKEKKKKKIGLKNRTKSTQEENVNLLLSILHCRDKEKAKKTLKQSPTKQKRSVSGSTKKLTGLKVKKKKSMGKSISKFTLSQASSRNSESLDPKFDQTLSSVGSSQERTPAKKTIGADSDASVSITSPEIVKSHDSLGMDSIMENESPKKSPGSPRSPRSPAKSGKLNLSQSTPKDSSFKNRIAAMMQSPNISVHETNVKNYDCHAGPSGACSH
mmetsp:Transcript_20323/g.27477  ORF Transcript_20323/g.27477 Transcript_20323/m.27477 type:complete len:227 (-) Transcript_20323:1530-2210(-)